MEHPNPKVQQLIEAMRKRKQVRDKLPTQTVVEPRGSMTPPPDLDVEALKAHSPERSAQLAQRPSSDGDEIRTDPTSTAVPSDTEDPNPLQQRFKSRRQKLQQQEPSRSAIAVPEAAIKGRLKFLASLDDPELQNTPPPEKQDSTSRK